MKSRNEKVQEVKKTYPVYFERLYDWPKHDILIFLKELNILQPADVLYRAKDELLERYENELREACALTHEGDLSEAYYRMKHMRSYAGNKEYSFENDFQLHEDLKELNIYSYTIGNQKKQPNRLLEKFQKPKKEYNAKMPHGYKLLNSYSGPNNGFNAYVFKKENDVVIVYRGTESKSDILTDARMLTSGYTSQVRDAQAVYDKVKSKYKGYRIITTGHSLGGTLSQFTGALNNIYSVTFNAYPAGRMLRDWAKRNNHPVGIYPDRIINYKRKKDIITTAKDEFDVGVTYEVSAKIADEAIDNSAHKIENMDSLSERKPYKTKARKSEALYPSDENPQCPGSYSVSGYTRADGTEVQGYTRSCGARHLK